MSARFADSTVLVTGGGSGIGRAAALAFARQGGRVVVAGRRPEALAETVALIEADGGTASGVPADLTRAEDAARVVAAAVQRDGRLHVAVNAIGIRGPVGPVADLDEAAWSEVLAANLTSVWLAMKHEIAHMREHGGGAIVNVASNVGRHVRYPGLAAYAASKAAVSALTSAAAREEIAAGIRINAVSPGPTDTPMSLRPGETEADRAARLQTALPIGRVGATEEIAAAVLWLASDEAAFAVGHDLVVDGGASA